MPDKHIDSYLKRAEETYPSVRQSPNSLKPEFLISPFQIEISSSTYSFVERFVKSIYQLSRKAEYHSKIQPEDNDILNVGEQNNSVLMAYDFHLDQEGAPKLIEINTNASGFLISDLLYDSSDKNRPWPEATAQLLKAFELEWCKANTPISVAIIDETLGDQKMLPEFYMYKDLFESNSWPTSITDFKALKWTGQDLQDTNGLRFNCVYNRFNDFYLRKPQSSHLREAYLSKKVIFTPQPREYLLLADKQRLIEWSQPEFWTHIPRSPEDIELLDKVLLKSYIPSQFENLETLWSQRKKYFFKPLRMYGGKSAFKGANISRTAFDRIFSQPGSMAQEFCPAPKFTSPDGTSWKYDLRFYVFKDQIQLGVARIYQGQVTNFGTAGGGFAKLRING